MPLWLDSSKVRRREGVEWRGGGRRGREREYEEERGGLDLSLIPPADPTTGKLVTEMKYTFPPAVSLSVHKHVP